MLLPQIIVTSRCSIGQIAMRSAWRPNAVFMMAPLWRLPSSNRRQPVVAARGGEVFELKQLVGRLVLIFGARPGAILTHDDIADLVYGDDPTSGPYDCMNVLATRVCQDRFVLAALGLHIHGVRRGWCMDAVPVRPIRRARPMLQAAE